MILRMLASLMRLVNWAVERFMKLTQESRTMKMPAPIMEYRTFRLPESLSRLYTTSAGKWMLVSGCKNNSHFLPDLVYSAYVVFIARCNVSSANLAGIFTSFSWVAAMFVPGANLTYVSSCVQTQLQ